MDEFVEIAAKMDELIQFEDEIILDGVRGKFVLCANMTPPIQNFIRFEWFDIQFFNCKRELQIPFKNPIELKEALLELFRLKFWKGHPITKIQEYNLKFYFQKLKQDVLHIDPQTCYICFENAREYKTTCGHSICYSCFVKSAKYVDQPTEGFMFICGLCRNEIFKADLYP